MDDARGMTTTVGKAANVKKRINGEERSSRKDYRRNDDLQNRRTWLLLLLEDALWSSGFRLTARAVTRSPLKIGRSRV
jgi:hypothetical protein